MTNTAKTIEDLKKFRYQVNQEMLNREIVSFNVGSIQIDTEKMMVNNEQMSETAVKKILGHLRVKNNFLDLGKKMTPSDWSLVKDKLKSATFDQTVHARRVTVDGVKKIDDIYLAAPKTTGIIEIDNIFDSVIDSIVSTGKDISCKSTCFLPDKDEVSITLLEHDNEVDIFSNGTDMWKIGKQLIWNGMNFSIAPFYERLVCSNGNVAPQFGFKSNISNNKFNIGKIQKVLEKEITLQSESLDKFLVDATNHLKDCNISVREFLRYRSMFNETNHSAIISRWLDDSYLNRAYGTIVTEESSQWQSSADSGKNAYEFFNDLTYIAAHPKEATLTDRERLDVQIKASNLLFQKSFDLECLAPVIDWKKHKVPSTSAPKVQI